jgi:hypothetical protein
MLSTAYFYFDLSFHLPECYLSMLHLEASGEHLINKKITSCFALHEYRLIVMRRHIERPAPASARLRQKAFNPRKKKDTLSVAAHEEGFSRRSASISIAASTPLMVVVVV